MARGSGSPEVIGGGCRDRPASNDGFKGMKSFRGICGPLLSSSSVIQTIGENNSKNSKRRRLPCSTTSSSNRHSVDRSIDKTPSSTIMAASFRKRLEKATENQEDIGNSSYRKEEDEKKSLANLNGNHDTTTRRSRRRKGVVSYVGVSGVQTTRINSLLVYSGVIIITMWTIFMLDSSPRRIASGAIATQQAQPGKPQGLNRELEKQIVDKILGEGYDKRIRPSGINNKTGQNDGPAVVRVNTLIRSISKIDDVTMEYSVQLTLRQEWVDERLAYNKMASYKNYNINSITLTEQERLWKPDLFFRNEKEGHFHKIIMPNVLLRINGDGSVLYSIRISLVLACPMDLKYYPLDKQNCTIEMASYGYLDDDLKFIWKEKNPVQINQPLTLPRFTLETFGTAFCTSRTATGAYSCLRVDLIFKREFSYYLIQIYIPCCMLVIVSWVSFWLDPNAIPARVSLGVTTLLTMATQISGINASLPPVSYTKAIDVWTGVCLTFVFGALLEFALVNYASRSDAHARMQQARQEEELRLKELEFHHRQQIAAANQHQRQHHHQQQQYAAAYGQSQYGQKFPMNRPEVPYATQTAANGQLKSAGLPLNGTGSPASGNANGPQQQTVGPNNGSNPQQQQQPNNGSNQQYTINIGDQPSDKQHLMSNGLPTINSFQFNGHSAGKQCEIHHSVSLHPTGNSRARTSSSNTGGGAGGSGARSKASVNFCRAWLNKFPSRSKRIDVISRIFFPKMFALFNLVYWTTYLFREDDIVQA